jgi:predicted DNA-binding transcriptional regulator YafY
MNRTDRLVAMVMHLQGRRLVRAAELARRYEVSVRTVYRDIAALGEAGVPIAGEPGVGYSLVPGYHLPPVMLTADEAAALFVGAEMVKQFTDASLTEAMNTAVDKLRAVLPRDRQEHVERLARQTVIVGRPGHAAANPAAHPWLLAVQRGVAQRRVLRLDYRAGAGGNQTVREVEPLGVVFYRGAWTLVAWCRLRRDVRHFRVDRIQKLEAQGETVPPRQDFSLARHLAEESAGDTLAARVWFAQAAQERAQAENSATMTVETARNGGAEFSFTTFSYEWLARWVLSFGTDAEAISPEPLRELVRRESEAIARRYTRRAPAAARGGS